MIITLGYYTFMIRTLQTSVIFGRERQRRRRRQTEKQRQTKRQRQIDRDRETDRETDRDRQIDRKTETERQKDRDRETERDAPMRLVCQQMCPDAGVSMRSTCALVADWCFHEIYLCTICRFPWEIHVR